MEAERFVNCPFCGDEMTILASFAGKDVSCPHCGVVSFVTGELQLATEERSDGREPRPATVTTPPVIIHETSAVPSGSIPTSGVDPEIFRVLGKLTLVGLACIGAITVAILLVREIGRAAAQPEIVIKRSPAEPEFALSPFRNEVLSASFEPDDPNLTEEQRQFWLAVAAVNTWRFVGYDEKATRPISNLVERGGKLRGSQEWLLSNREWVFGGRRQRYRAELRGEARNAGEDLVNVLGELLSAFRATRHYSDEFQEVGDQLLRSVAEMDLQPGGKPRRIRKADAGYRWELFVCDHRKPGETLPRWRVSLSFEPDE